MTKGGEEMGGARSTSGKRGSGGVRIKNPAGIPSNHMTESEYLRRLGLEDPSSGFSVDKMRGNRMLSTTQGRRKFEREAIKAENEYQKKREAAKEQYKKLVDSGKIKPKTEIEKTLTAAHGNPELSATQAARRMAAKRGYDWKTGKKLKAK